MNIVHATSNVLKNKMRKKENLKKFLLKKREIFLMQMKIDQKKEQIRFFEEKINEKRTKLKSVERKITKDMELFNKFLDKNKIETKEKIKEAEKETKSKLSVITKLKSLAELKTTKLTINSKLLEKFESLFIYKKFLDRLTPKTVKI